MNYIDIVIAVILIAFGMGGWKKGIIREATTLLGLALGLYGAFHFSDFTAAKLLEYVEIEPKYLGLVAFVVTFVVLAILVNLLGKLVANIVKSLDLGFIDKLGGFLVGLAKGLLICSLFVMVLNVLKLTQVVKEDTREESILYPYVEKTVPYIYEGYGLVKEAIQSINEEKEEGHSAESEDNII